MSGPMAGGTQIFVRNREGKVFGPIEPSTVELLIEGGILQGLLQVSTDGESYALPFRFPEIRDFFPRHLWGDDSRRDVQLDSEGVAAQAGDTSPVAPDGAPAPPVVIEPILEPIAPPTTAPPATAARTPTGNFPKPPVLTATPARAHRTTGEPAARLRSEDAHRQLPEASRPHRGARRAHRTTARAPPPALGSEDAHRHLPEASRPHRRTGRAHGCAHRPASHPSRRPDRPPATFRSLPSSPPHRPSTARPHRPQAPRRARPRSPPSHRGRALGRGTALRARSRPVRRSHHRARGRAAHLDASASSGPIWRQQRAEDLRPGRARRRHRALLLRPRGPHHHPVHAARKSRVGRVHARLRRDRPLPRLTAAGHDRAGRPRRAGGDEVRQRRAGRPVHSGRREPGPRLPGARPARGGHPPSGLPRAAGKLPLRAPRAAGEQGGPTR